MSRYLPAIFLLLFGVPLFAQESGYVITNRGDTLRGEITFPSSFSDDERIRFEALNGSSEDFNPAEVAGYYHPKRGNYVSSLIIDLTDKRLLGTPKFLERLASGPASLYKLSYTERIRGSNDVLLEKPARKYYYVFPDSYLAVGNQGELDKLLEQENSCTFQRNNYSLSDFQVTQFFRELSACKDFEFFSNEKSPKTSRSLVFFGGLGYANAGWNAGIDILGFTDFNRAGHVFGEAGVMLPLNDGFRIAGSLSYDKYENTGELNVVPGVPAWNETRTISGTSRVDASFLTINVDGQLALNSKALKLRTYLIGGFRYGMLQQSDYSIKSALVRKDNNQQPFFIYEEFDADGRNTDDRAGPNNLLGANIGFWVDFLPGKKVSPFLKLTGQYSVSTPNAVYNYHELRAVAGIRFGN